MKNYSGIYPGNLPEYIRYLSIITPILPRKLFLYLADYLLLWCTYC